jgi:AcrR family transcriptional regulator
MEKLEKDIIEKAVELFNRYGLRPVTMDDMAREMGMSKKTIYKYFSNKEELVFKAVELITEEALGRLNEAIKKSANAIDNLFKIDEVVCDSIRNHDPSMQFQLERYYPEVHSHLNQKRRTNMLKFTRQNIERGKKEGLYRSELQTEIISQLYFGRVLLMTEHEHLLAEDIPLTQMMREILIYHIRGMATTKGLEYLDEKLKQLAENEN